MLQARRTEKDFQLRGDDAEVGKNATALRDARTELARIAATLEAPDPARGTVWAMRPTKPGRRDDRYEPPSPPVVNQWRKVGPQ